MEDDDQIRLQYEMLTAGLGEQKMNFLMQQAVAEAQGREENVQQIDMQETTEQNTASKLGNYNTQEKQEEASL